MTSFQDYMHYEYPDETGLRLVIHRDASAGCAWVTVAPPEERRPLDLPGVAVLAEHVPEVCCQLADKAGSRVVVLDASWIDGDSQAVGIHRVSQGRRPGNVGLSVQTGRAEMPPEMARMMAAALAHQADIADEAAAKADVAELAEVIAATYPTAPDGAGAKIIARAVHAAGYRKAET